MLDFTALKLLQKVVLFCRWVKNLLHHLLHHFIFFPDEHLLAQYLSLQLLILSTKIIQFLFKVNLFFV
jgi:hypothetical protein